MEIVELYRKAADEFDARVDAIKDDQWNDPTPCTEWDVSQLVNHLVYEDRWAVPLMAGKTIEEVGEVFEGDLLGDDPKGAWKSARTEAQGAIEEKGALARTVHVSFGDIPADLYVFQLFSDHLIHAWDLARGIGADEALDPELMQACYDLSKPQEDLLKSSGSYGDKIEPPEGADLQTKLLAIFGRVP